MRRSARRRGSRAAGVHGMATTAVRPLARFAKQWLLQAGFRDGAEGWVLCATSAFGVLLKYAPARAGREGGST